MTKKEFINLLPENILCTCCNIIRNKKYFGIGRNIKQEFIVKRPCKYCIAIRNKKQRDYLKAIGLCTIGGCGELLESERLCKKHLEQRKKSDRKLKKITMCSHCKQLLTEKEKTDGEIYCEECRQTDYKKINNQVDKYIHTLAYYRRKYPTNEKKCTHCQEVVSLDEYYLQKNKHTLIGYSFSAACKKCLKAKANEKKRIKKSKHICITTGCYNKTRGANLCNECTKKKNERKKIKSEMDGKCSLCTKQLHIEEISSGARMCVNCREHTFRFHWK